MSVERVLHRECYARVLRQLDVDFRAILRDPELRSELTFDELRRRAQEIRAAS